jgi:hypothetical protein
LFSEQELARIFDAILCGPDKEQFKTFMGEQFSEDSFRVRRQHFHLRQFRPFKAALFGKYRKIYDELLAAGQEPTDDDYSLYSGGESKTGGSRSPKSVQELAALSDDDLVVFLNHWEDVHRDEKQWWIDVDFTGLGIAFQQIIEADPARFLAWGATWHEIERPIYFRYALEVAAKRIKTTHHVELAQWFDLCDWIIQRQDAVQKGDNKPSETSRQNPSWDSARQAVVDLIEACVSKEVNVGIEWRPRIFSILHAICLADDYYLDADKPIVTPRDYLTDAINTTRGRALQNLINYAYWLRRHQSEMTPIAEVTETLESRFAGKRAQTIKVPFEQPV